MDYRPIRKVLVGAVAALLTAAAQKVGVAPEVAAGYAPAIVGFALAYFVKDPRVKRAGEIVADLREQGATYESSDELNASAFSKHLND